MHTKPMNDLTLTILLVSATLLAAAGCGAEAETPPPPPKMLQVLPVRPTLIDDTVVNGGQLLMSVEGTELLVPNQVTLTFKGSIDGVEVDAFSLGQFVENDTGLEVRVRWEDLSAVLGVTGGETFNGDITVEVEDLGESLKGEGILPGAQINFASTLMPSLVVPETAEHFLNHTSSWSGGGILREGEGQTLLAVQGTFTDDTGAERSVNDRVLVSVGEGGRASADIRWSAYLFGVRPGDFVGTVQPINVHSGGQEVVGNTGPIEITQRQTEIDGFVGDSAASRGQIATLVGRGFIPADPERGQSMFFLFDGTYYLFDGSELELTGDNVVRIAPESVPSFTEAKIVLRSETDPTSTTPRLIGITAMPGTFEGTITPVLLEGATTVLGLPYTGEFSVAPTEQNVYIKFLPGFSTSLDVYGIRNVEPEIRQRIFEVVRRDYRDVNVVFTDQEPKDFVEYSLIEVGGPDPNNAGLFGLDNTAGKDTGNIRLNDWIGGTNAESGELGYYVFGGVFIESFKAFSPSLDASSQVASPMFDAIFAPFMPALGGTVVDASEVADGPRAEQIATAVHAFGSVIGNTITHEIGHSLGLAFFPEDEFAPGERFHNDFDEPGAIMDSGGNRAFEERAELDVEGAVEPHFNSRNKAYLQRVLPLPQ